MNGAIATTVLIVEDERDMAEGLRNAFERHGFEVLVANDGQTVGAGEKARHVADLTRF